jgi:hypothetical protein
MIREETFNSKHQPSTRLREEKLHLSQLGSLSQGALMPLRPDKIILWVN